MTRPNPLTVHLYAMRLIRALEDAEPGQPIGVYFAQAQGYVMDRTPRTRDFDSCASAMAWGRRARVACIEVRPSGHNALPWRMEYALEVSDITDGDFWRAVLRHLKAGCPAPKPDPGPTTLPAMCGGLTLHA